MKRTRTRLVLAFVAGLVAGAAAWSFFRPVDRYRILDGFLLDTVTGRVITVTYEMRTANRWESRK